MSKKIINQSHLNDEVLTAVELSTTPDEFRPAEDIDYDVLDTIFKHEDLFRMELKVI